MTFETTRSVELSERAQRVIPGGLSSASGSSSRHACSCGPRGAGSGTRTATSTSTIMRVRPHHPRPRRPGRARGRHGGRRDLDVVGLGVTELEIELAAQDPAPRAVGGAGAVLEQRLGGDVPRHPGVPCGDGRRLLVKFQGCYHGWHDYVAANVISRTRATSAASTRRRRVSCPRPSSGWRCCPSTMSPRSRTLMARRGRRRRRGHPGAGHPHHRLRHPAPGVPRRAAATTTTEGSVLIFDEVVTGLPARPGWLPGDRGHPPGPVDVRQGHRQWLPARRGVLAART